MAEQVEALPMQKGKKLEGERHRVEGLAGTFPMKRSVTVRIGEFACKAIAGDEDGLADRVPPHAVRAIRYYLNDRGLERPGWLFPAFMRDEDPGEEIELQLDIDADLWGSLEDEARRQGVTVQRLAEHAAFYIAAEVNAGHVTRRILDDLGIDS